MEEVHQARSTVAAAQGHQMAEEKHRARAAELRVLVAELMPMAARLDRVRTVVQCEQTEVKHQLQVPSAVSLPSSSWVGQRQQLRRWLVAS